MKLNGKNLPVLIRLLVLFAVVCTLAWELVERLVGLAGVQIDLSVGPVGFDIEVIAVWLQANPGTLIGFIPGFLVFRKL